MVVKVLSKYQFSDEMGDRFSYEALEALYDYLEEYSDATNEPYELDPVALSLEFREWESIEEYNDEMGTDFLTLDQLEEVTQIIPFGTEAFLAMVY
jgi:hypothetical protein